MSLIGKKEFVIEVSDISEWLKNYNGPKFQFVLSDPPYEISHLGGWDSSGIAYSTDLYTGLLNVMEPGAFLCFYGFTRTHHRVMVAMEDAGFIIHKAIFAWVYTTGNPLGAANLQRRIDDFYVKRYGGYCRCENPVVRCTERAFINPEFSDSGFDVSICNYCGKPIREILSEIQWGKSGGMKLLGGSGYGNDNKQVIAKSMTPEAEMLKNYTYGLAWSKPMMEPIILAQKPFDTNDQISGILKYGTGIINVHAARHTSRWPGNFIAVHDPGCSLRTDGTWDCSCGIDEYASQDKDFYEKIPTFGYGLDDIHLASIDWLNYDSKPSQKERKSYLDNLDIIYIDIEMSKDEKWVKAGQRVKLLVDTAQLPPKVIGVYSTAEENEWSMMLYGKSITGLFPMDCKYIISTETNSIIESKTLSYLRQWFINENMAIMNCEMEYGIKNAHSVSNISECQIIIQPERAIQYPIANLAQSRIRLTLSAEKDSAKKPVHPSVKPINVNKYLGSLFLPPEEFGIRRALVPFSGSGSEIIGLLHSGWDSVYGVELNPEYAQVSLLRANHFINSDVSYMFIESG